MRLHSRRVLTPTATIAATVTVAQGRIVAVRARRDVPDGAWDLGDRWLAPGLIDGHVHGGGGAQCATADPDEVIRVARFHATHGTTSLLATTVAAGVDELEGSLAAVALARRLPEGATVLGAHLEGPFLSPRWPGAMDATAFVAPDERALARLLAAGMADGDYRLGGAAVRARGGRATLGNGSVIAGSTLTMEAALAGAVRLLGVTVEQAVTMASANPARLLGLGDRKGAIVVGFDADLVVLDDDLRAVGTLVGGRWVSVPPER